MSVQTELNKVQEVLTKGIRSKIPSPASEGSPCLRLASPSSWVCPACPRRPVSNLHIFFFILALPTQTRGRSGRQAGRRRWVLFKHARSIPLPAPTSWTPRLPHLTPGGARVPARVWRGPLPPRVRAASSGTTSFILFALVLAFSFPLCLDGRVSDRIEGVLFGWLVRFSVTPRQRNGFSQEDLLELVIW